jgi:hypothetical protein
MAVRPVDERGGLDLHEHLLLEQGLDADERRGRLGSLRPISSATASTPAEVADLLGQPLTAAHPNADWVFRGASPDDTSTRTPHNPSQQAVQRPGRAWEHSTNSPSSHP